MSQRSGLKTPIELAVGQPFNPYRMFTVICIPDTLARNAEISLGAKLVYGRLARYAGQNGKCYPSVTTLSGEIGLGPRQTQKYIAELERNRLIVRRPRFSGGAQTSNAYDFLWHELFEKGMKDCSEEGVHDRSGEGMHDRAYEESQIEESHYEEKNTDIDYLLTNRKKRASRPDAAVLLLPSQCKHYPKLRELLACYMHYDAADTKDYPTDRIIVDIMKSGGGASEDEVCSCISYFFHERGLKPGTRTGPRSFAWFVTAVQDHFTQQREREQAADPGRQAARAKPDASGLSEEQFEKMTNAL